MRIVKLGKNGPDVSALGLGCMGMSISYGTPNDDESVATIHRALDLGVNLNVTAGTRYPEKQMKSLGI